MRGGKQRSIELGGLQVAVTKDDLFLTARFLGEAKQRLASVSAAAFVEQCSGGNSRQERSSTRHLL